MGEDNLTERQRRWFASVRDGLARDTGRSLEEWVTVARTCPEAAHRARLRWFKETHGLLQNRASVVLNAAFGGDMTAGAPQTIVETLWVDADSRAIMAAVAERALRLHGVIQTARKGFTAWSRTVQFAAMRPSKGGRALLGLAVPTQADPRLTPRGNQSWSERLSSKIDLAGVDMVDDHLDRLLKQAWTCS